MLKLLNALIAVVGGVVGAMVLYYTMNWLVERLPDKWEERIKPYVFIGPALLLIGVFLVYPAIQTVILSFQNRDSTQFVGFQNYIDLARDAGIRDAIFNNVLWIIFVPPIVVAIGLAVAVLADRLRPRAESAAKAIIFLPMAISFVGAGTIFRFIYTFRPEGRPQIGLLNAIWTRLGGDPIDWLQVQSFNINDFFLMAILVWIQAGFAMVLLSAAIKNVPEETIEAARIDGATERQIFWRVVMPQIRSTIAVVLTTLTITVLKVFDIVYVMTNGRAGTDIVANRFVNELFVFNRPHWATAIVTALILAVIPVMIYNIRRFRAEEATQ
jgi:alpha-glucoside transport system permease protein